MSVLTTKNMLVYSTDWYGRKSFRMLPMHEECPFNEVIFDPNTGVLAVISRDQKEKPQMLPKLNDKGMPIPLKLVNETTQPRFIEERRMMDTYYEYYLDSQDDIEHFIELFAFNPEHPSLSVIRESKETEESKQQD
jgi:hypothetical protein